MAKQVRLTLTKAIAKANLRRADSSEKPITMNSLATQTGVEATTITRLARSDDNAASALSLDLASNDRDSAGLRIYWKWLINDQGSWHEQ